MPSKLTLSICLILLALLVGLSACGRNEAEGLLLIYGQPNGDLAQGVPFPFGIYRLRLNPPGLDSIWSPPEYTRIEGVRLYPELGTVLITEGYPPPHALNVFSMDSLKVAEHYEFDTLDFVMRINQYANGFPWGFILVDYYRFSGTDSSREQHLLIWPDSVKWREDIFDFDVPGERRLAGARTAGGGEDDVASFGSVAVPQRYLEHKGYGWDAFPVPDSVIQFKTSAGWTMIAQEPTFLALLSVPERNGLIEREVLIYDRVQKSWHSIIVPGNETALRPINGWIVGDVIFSDPQTDWVRRSGVAGIPSDSTVVINPFTRNLYVVTGGHRPEVLWIENNMAYYRTDDSLWCVTITDEGLTDRELLLVHPKIEHVHWAFRRTKGKQ